MNRDWQSLLAGVALLLAGAALAVSSWSAVCIFPSVVWNDVRLAPAIALAQGWPIYPTATHGTINTWTYGPLPVLWYGPAALASTAAGALVTAGLLNAVLTLGPLALVCSAWPVAGNQGETRRARLIAFLLCLAVWPPRHFEVIFSDNLAIACGLLGNLWLVRARRPHEWWLAALAASAAVASKQIALGIPLAQVLWVGLTGGWRAGGRHALRCVAAGALLLVLAAAAFGGRGLWYTLVELPGLRPWEWAAHRLTPMLPELAWQLGVPVAALALIWRTSLRPALLLPALAWACTLPAGLMAMLKTGGWLNSLHSVALWLPPAATVLLAAALAARPARVLYLGFALALAVVACGRVLLAPRLLLRPAVASYAEAEEIAARFRGRIWFPFHPLVTLYSEKRYYHDEDGLYARRLSRQGVGAAHAAAHLPPALQVMALHQDWSDWGIARSMLPPGAHPVPVGSWTLWLPREKTPTP